MSQELQKQCEEFFQLAAKAEASAAENHWKWTETSLNLERAEKAFTALTQLQQDVRPLLEVMKNQYQTLYGIKSHGHISLAHSCPCRHAVDEDVKGYPLALETFLAKHPECK